MLSMDVSGLKRNPDVIKSHLVKMGSGIVTKANIQVIFPARFLQRGLADISTTTLVTGILAIVDEDDNYAVMNIPIGIPLTPYKMENVEINGIEYIILNFEKESVFCENTQLVIDATTLYPILDEFLLSGKVPWYMGYEDLSKIFSKSKKYADTNIGANILGFSLLTAIVARNPKNKKQYLRLSAKTYEAINKITPAYVGLKNIYYAINSVLSKAAGAYAQNGITSSMVDPQDKTTQIEEIIRS